MVLPFALWGTAMTAMAPLVSSGGPVVVAFLRLFPAGIAVLIAVLFLGRRWTISRSDLVWFFVFTFVDASLFQICLAKGLVETGAGLGSVLIDSQPLIVALLARSIFGDAINPIGWVGLIIGLTGIICLGAPPDVLQHWLLLGQPASLGKLLNAGEIWMLAAAISMALGTVLIRFACRESDPVAVTGWHMVLGSLPLLAWHFFETDWPLWPAWAPGEWVLMTYASLFGGGFGLWNVFLVRQS